LRTFVSFSAYTLLSLNRRTRYLRVRERAAGGEAEEGEEREDRQRGGGDDGRARKRR
jgi:hypothetical protein